MVKTLRTLGFRRARLACPWALYLVLASIAGCGAGDSTNPNADSKAGPPRVIKIAAASDLKFALTEVIERFQKTHPDVRVQPTFGASGGFFAQLLEKAEFEMFLSADLDYPRRLVEADLALEDSFFPYAIGHLVLWVPNDSPLRLERKGLEEKGQEGKGLEALLDPVVKKVAIANPKVAPYGRAAEAALRHFGLEEPTREKWILGESVSQAAQMVESGGADAGLISLSLALSPTLKDKGRFTRIPDGAHPPLEQAGVILSWAKNQDACRRFRDFLLAGEGADIFTRYGFDLPTKSSASSGDAKAAAPN